MVRLAILLAFVTAVGVLCMPSTFLPGDPLAWREESRAMLRGELAVDPRLATGYGERGQYFVETAQADGSRWYSKYGIANSLMSLPPTLVDQWIHGVRTPGETPDVLIYNLYQVFLTVLVAAVLFHLAGRYTARPLTRVLYVLATLYATHLWFYQRAQSAESYLALFYTAWFALFTRYLSSISRTGGRPDRRAHLALTGSWLFAGLLVTTRIIFGLLLPVIVVIVTWAMWRLNPSLRWRQAATDAAFILLPPCAILLTLGLINQVKFGSPFLTGYHVWMPEAHRIIPGYWEGVVGFFADVRSSIFVYFPVLVFALFATRRFARQHPLDALVMWTTFAVILVATGKTLHWHGAWTYGPRYLIFGLPVVSLPFILWVDWFLDRPRRVVTWLAAGATAVTLLASAYVAERKNRLDFFVNYRLAEELAPFGDASTEAYFEKNHSGWISADIYAHRRRVEDLAFMKAVWDRVPMDRLTDLRWRVAFFSRHYNYYWAPEDQRLIRR
jgi:hypothetical protein